LLVMRVGRRPSSQVTVPNEGSSPDVVS